MADEERDEKSRDIKVTDRRMFTPDGKLKEEYRWLEEAQPAKEEAAQEPAVPPEREEASTVAEPAGPSPEAAAAGTQPAGPSAPPGPFEIGRAHV